MDGSEDFPMSQDTLFLDTYDILDILCIRYML